ncbi:MAG: B12-binding domain-containing radical SAM protein [Myxococcales bacterium]|nr:B12-binding domain-containing radical SAM protein [Myxococcales bacterium]
MRVAFASLYSPQVVHLGMLHVAAVLRERGHEVHFCEAHGPEDLVRRLRPVRPDVVGFGATTGMHDEYLAWAAAVKRALGARTLLGGAHPTFVPGIVAHPALDAVFQGEAEESTPELCERFLQGSSEPVAGVWYKAGGALVKGPVRPPPADLDALPSPAFDLVYDGDPDKGRFHVKPFLGSRGCAYHCTYCGNAGYLSLYGRHTAPVRKRSPARLVEEIRAVDRRWGMKLVWLADASLLTDAPWAEELAGRIRRDVGKPFFCKVRADHVTEAAAAMLGRAGCYAVGMGIESGAERVRTRVLGRKMADETIVQASQRLRAAGIRLLTFNMVGIPTETFEDALATVDLNIACAPAYAEATLLQPYPGTPLARWAVRKGHFDGNFDGVDYSYLSTTPVRYGSNAERDRIERLQRLFGLAVEFPEVRRALPWLVRLPLPRLHDALFRIWYRLGFGRRIHGMTPP